MSVDKRGWIGVDLDGTLAHWEQWGPDLHIGAPIAPMVARVRDWLDAGYNVKIMTARIGDHPLCRTTREERIKAISDWTREHIGTRLEVTDVKDFQMLELWDDRAVQVEPNTGEPVTYWQTRI
jgi:hypothetical protein